MFSTEQDSTIIADLNNPTFQNVNTNRFKMNLFHMEVNTIYNLTITPTSLTHAVKILVPNNQLLQRHTHALNFLLLFSLFFSLFQPQSS